MIPALGVDVTAGVAEATGEPGLAVKPGGVAESLPPHDGT